MRKFLFLNLWFGISIITLILSFSLLSYFTSKKSLLSQNNDENSYYQIYTSLPPTINSYETNINAIDGRPDLIRKYLTQYNSPLADSAAHVLTVSEKFKTEAVPDLWRYILAIGQCESNLGVKIPKDSFNAWGLGIPTGAKNGLVFKDWPEGINAVGKFLRKLVDSGKHTPEEWGATYAPPSVLNGNSWAKCVRYFSEEIK